MKTKISRRVVTLLSAFALLNSAFSQTAPTIAGAGQPGEPLGGQPLLICLTSGGADQSSAKADVAVKDKAAASNDSGKNINMMYPTDNTYWTKLKEFVDYEPISAIDPELRGVLASIGIVKGQPFQPNAKQQELLKKAVETAPKMILRSVSSDGRTDASSTTRIASTRTSGPVAPPSGCKNRISTLRSGPPISKLLMRLRRQW